MVSGDVLDPVLCQNTVAGPSGGSHGSTAAAQPPAPSWLPRAPSVRDSATLAAMSPPLQFIILLAAGWVNRYQQDVIDYLKEENRVLREQLGHRRLSVSAQFDGAPVTEIDGRVVGAGGESPWGAWRAFIALAPSRTCDGRKATGRLSGAGPSSCASPPRCSGRSPAEPYPPAEARRIGRIVSDDPERAALPVSVSRRV